MSMGFVFVEQTTHGARMDQRDNAVMVGGPRGHQRYWLQCCEEIKAVALFYI